MAKLLLAGEFASEGERRAAETLKALPSQWVIISNKILPAQNGRTYETDFIIVADRWVFLLDEKSWHGKITGTDQVWVRADGSSAKSPLNKADYVAKVLAGHIRWRVPQLNDQFFTRGGVLLSTAEHLPILTGEPRAGTAIFLLGDVCKRLRKLDEDGGSLRVQDYREQIVKSLHDLSAIPTIPRQVGMYTVEEPLFTRPGVRAFQATLPVGGTVEPRTLMVYDLGAYGDDGNSGDRREAQAFYLKEFQALKHLQTSGLVPKVSDPFPWSDDHLVLPIEPLPGHSLAARAQPETRDDLTVEILLASAAFKALDMIHRAGVLHRALGPDSVYVLAAGEKSGEKPKVGFNNFYAARLGNQSISISLNALAIEDPYAAPELAIGYGRASAASDTYSLALVFLERMSGTRVMDLRRKVGEPVVVPPLRDRWPSLPSPAINELTDIFAGIVGERLADQRWTAGEVGELLGDLARKLRSEEPATEPVVLDDGRYEVQRVLGRGSSAITYLATDRVSGDSVALKRFHHPQEAMQQAKAEWDALKQIKSERLPSIFDIFDPQKDIHVKLEYIPGPTLQQVEAEFPWSLERWRSLARDLLETLGLLENRHILHRDVKPANIILQERDGRPVLIDCGFALRRGEEGHPAGTLRFLPPEGLDAAVPPPSCDRYAVAVVLYRVLTGQYPDICDDGEALAALRLAGRTSEELSIIRRILGVLRHAMSPDVAARPVSAAALRDAIAHAMQAETAASAADGERRLAALVSPWVGEVRGLYRNSSAGNANNRGMDSDFVRQTYIPTALDERLQPLIVESQPRAVFLSGNPGDGKTAFLERVRQHLEGRGALARASDASGWELELDGHTYRSCYDASEARGGESADEQLSGKLTGLDGDGAPAGGLTVLVAINDGRLADFFEREQTAFGWLARQIRKAQRQDRLTDSEVWVIDLKRRSFVGSDKSQGSSIMRRVLSSLVSEAQWQICAGCVAQTMCPIVANAAALRRPETARRLEHLLLLTHLRQQRHITMRDLRSTLAYLITGDAGCQDIHAIREGRDESRTTSTLTYWRTAFATPDTVDDLTADLAQLDPGAESRPELDRFLYFHRHGADAAQRGALFADGSDLSPQTYATPAEWIATMKRRLYFEGRSAEDHRDAERGEREDKAHILTGGTLLPYRYATLFIRALHGEAESSDLRRRIARGILRSDGVNVAATDGRMGVVVNASEEQQLIMLKEFALADFVVEPVMVNGRDVIEAIPEILQVRRRTGGPALELTLDLFEVLMRLADGLQPSALELRPLLEDLVPFKSALLLYETKDLTVIEGQGRIHHITQREGKIVRTAVRG